MKPLLAFAIALILLPVVSAQSEAPPTLGSGIDQANFDPSVRPQDDLFRAVNGAWLAKTEIPADRADYGAFTALAEQAEKDVLAIVQDCANDKDAAAGTEKKKIGDLYAAFMDQDCAEQLGIEPIAGTLASIDAIATKADLVRVLAELARDGVPAPSAYTSVPMPSIPISTSSICPRRAWAFPTATTTSTPSIRTRWRPTRPTSSGCSG